MSEFSNSIGSLTLHHFSHFLPWQLFVFFVCFSLTGAGVPLSRYEALLRQQSQENGLYNSTDRVFTLSDVNFPDVVLHQNRSTLVEFYNSYCGHCKRFAPKYKELAAQCYPWRELLLVTAIDCAAEENNGICREYEIMGYPTLRYFSPAYTPTNKNFGRTIDTQEVAEIRATLAEWVAAENRTSAMTNWPNFANLSASESAKAFTDLTQDTHVLLLILVYEPENSTVGSEMILQFHRWPEVLIRRVTDPETATIYQIGETTAHKVAAVSPNGLAMQYTPVAVTFEAYAATIRAILVAKHLQERPEQTTVISMVDTLSSYKQDIAETIKEVQRNRHAVYQADLEMAIHGILFNEIPKVRVISGERLMALQPFLAALKHYHTLGHNGQTLLDKLHEFTMQFNDSLTGKDFERAVVRLHTDGGSIPLFTSNRYVGCASSRPGLRGYTCSLWLLFHSMTVQAGTSNRSEDPLEVLGAIHGYVKHFFGCTNCAQHFQEMAKRLQLWNTSSKEAAILWLWTAHNEVNARLSGDDTEDLEFPKKTFPSKEDCPSCYRSATASPDSKAFDVDWNKAEVLKFMHRIHHPKSISTFGISIEPDERINAERLRQKRMIGSVFTDMDMRMGILLYGFCVIMMVVAFKLFAFKGYRRKPYAHDLIGKV